MTFLRSRAKPRVWSSCRNLRAQGLLCALAGSLLATLAGCELNTPDASLDTGKIDLQAQALKVLRLVFPELSEEDLVEVSGTLSLKQILELKDELETVRKAVVEFSDKLYTSAAERVAERKQELAPHNDGFPLGLAAVGSVCSYDASNQRGEVRLSGVFDGKQSVSLQAGQVSLSVDGAARDFSLACNQGGQTVDIVFLIDITGSMSNVIDSVRDSVVSFVDLIEESGVRGTVSVVSFQDSVGVNTTFQQPAPASGYERSPFFAPVSLSDAGQVDALRGFVNRLEANSGGDAPENLAGAVDFARNNVIGYTTDGQPNLIGDGRQDPVGSAPFPKLASERQVFVVLTDVTFHGDGQDARNSSLLTPFVPRDAAEILASLQRTGSTVHVSDPSWMDSPLDPKSETVDADYWAIHTGGVGEDTVAGYSLVDLELVVVAEETGLLDITLDKILQSSCTLRFEGALSASAEVSVSLNVGEQKVAQALRIERF